MRRIALGVTTESHPLYGVFMGHLFNCIFEWDVEDVNLLMKAKQGEFTAAGISQPSDSSIRKAITKQELAAHCRRRTRGVEATVKLVESLLLSMASATDTLGVPLLREDIKYIWEEQKKHIKCIQDPPAVQLYTVTEKRKRREVYGYQFYAVQGVPHPLKVSISICHISYLVHQLMQ